MSKNVLITAATKNTGYAMSKLFAQNGWTVHMTSRDAESAAAAAERLMNEVDGAKAYGYALEQGNVPSIKGTFAEIRKNAESLDAVICNAAHLGMGYDIFNTTEADFDAVMGANLKGTFFVVREASKMMLQNGGSIVLLGSVQGHGAVEGRHLYGVSKAGIATMAKYMAYDLAVYNIRVNSLAAGAIHTDRWDVFDAERQAAIRKNYPIGRESTMEEIAKGAYYLASDMSTSVTGTELVVDSGVLMSVVPYERRKEFRRPEFENEAKQDAAQAKGE